MLVSISKAVEGSTGTVSSKLTSDQAFFFFGGRMVGTESCVLNRNPHLSYYGCLPFTQKNPDVNRKINFVSPNGNFLWKTGLD